MTSRQWGSWLLLTLLACLGNYYPFPLLFGVDLLLGGILVYLILFYFGLPLALCSALPAYLVTWLVWGHPWAAINYLMELVLVGSLLRHFKFRELTLLVGVYWIFAGAPLIITFYRYLLELPWLDVWMVMGKQGLNSLANAALALTLAYLLPAHKVGRWNKQQPQLAITDLFFYLPTLMLILGSLGMVVVMGHFQMEKAKQEIHQELKHTQQVLRIQLEDNLRELHTRLPEIYHQCTSFDFGRFTGQRQCFNRHALESPFQAFFTLSEPEPGWQPMNSLSPRQQLTEKQLSLLQLAVDRLQTKGAARTQTLASTGQLFLLRRLPTEQGQNQWLVGLVDKNYLPRELLSGSNHPYLVYSLQLGRQELFSSESSRLPLDASHQADSSGRMQHWLPDKAKTDITRWSESIYFVQRNLDTLDTPLPGLLRVEITPRLEQENLFRMYGLLFVLAFMMLLLGLVVSRGVAAWFARPIRDLVKVAAAIPQQLQVPTQAWRWPETYRIQEFQQLSDQLKLMGRLLKEQFDELQSREQQLEAAVARRTQELVDAHQHLQSVMDSMEAVLWSAELDASSGKGRFRLSFISPSVLNLTGYTARAWLNDPIKLLQDSVNEKQVGRVLHELQHMAQRGRGRIVIRFANPKQKGWRVLTLRYWLVYSAEGRPLRVDGLITDVTEASAAEEKVKEQEELLLHQSRRAAMGEMVSNIAHQWRQPLNSLRLTLGNLEDAKAYGELTEESFDEHLQQADKLIDQMNQTVRDFLTFFRPRKEPEIFNLAALVDQSLDVMQTSLQGLELELSLDRNLQVQGYPNEVVQVLLVLLQNAREALKDQKINKAWVRVRLQKQGDQAELSVEDNAGGIPESILPQIFDPYFTTKAEGSGIGLYMAKMVIEKQMQGEIRVTNSEQGALFTLSFPLTSQPLH
ncbi:sensor histidine kinase [Marinospirillum sp.]|uniref:sensor histidine kinase n=1 Tax=Marinospirillum sp. TaxID=2183934 RepID=UPI00384D95F8